VLVWVASYPRSGNTLTLLTLRDVFGTGRLGADFDEQFQLGRIPQKALPGEGPEWELPRALEGLTGDDLLDALRERSEAYFIKTHRLARAADPAPALYLVRDGRDALVSHAHLVHATDVQRFRGMNYNRRLRELIHPGVRVQGGWSGSVRAWRERDAPTAIVHFEHLIDDPARVLARACAQIDVPLGEPLATLPSFEELHRRFPIVFRRGKVGGWVDEMNTRQHARFWRHHEEQMRALGYGEEPRA
jgi:hypothetical protein